MRVLVAHNQYRSELPSGENRIVEQEVQDLANAGVEVATYMRSSDEIADMNLLRQAGLPVDALRGNRAGQDVAEIIRRFQPHVLHLHNPYPLISPVVIDVAVHAGVPVVHTVHNYRQVCVKGTFFRDGGVCEDCRGKRFPWPAVLHRCYRGSRLQSTVMATALTVHRKRWLRVSRFLAVSEFVARHLLREGIPEDRVEVQPNPVPDPGPPSPPGKGLLFAGRLDEEKGVELLLDAWERADLDSRLVIAGDGPLGETVRRRTATRRSVEATGQVPADEMPELYRDCAAVVVPSIWYEGFPTAIIEAFAHGRAVLASDLGSMSTIVTDEVGWLASPTPEEWARMLVAVTRDGSALRERAEGARRAYLEGGFSDPTARLLEVYANL